MTASRAWNVPLLLHIFPPTVAHHIFSIRCHEANDREDFCRWRWGPDFSIKDAYERCVLHTLEPPSTHWKVIWSLPVTQRIRVFLWLSLRQKLLTNMERNRRGLTNNAGCLRCGLDESVTHVYVIAFMPDRLGILLSRAS
ncbi:hypothetical protein V6N11_047206 [Hibiscus sabdariffa]|uniref:Reverse transcriptase zinc-binding domain-containing protein n=2 Tax=Hibiscus sabdariffa TaxID=183260 RepID=A0ABR1ZS96_9ROSI